MNHCDTNYWPYRHQLAANYTLAHIRQARALEGMATHKDMIGKALLAIRKMEDAEDAKISERKN